MAESENALLRRYVRVGDTEAFAEIVRRYAGLVYGTCLRVLADTDQAADATQETFFQLVKRAGEIRGPLAAWLHRVAVHKAVDAIRASSARRQREERYTDTTSAEEATWHELSAHVDEALNQLDGPTRELLIRHYLEGVSMTDLAMELDISRPTISRQISSGVARLRAHLQRRGVLVTAAGLSTLLGENIAQSAPAAILEQLGKIAMTGAGGASATAATGAIPGLFSGALAAAAKLKAIVVVAAVVVGAGVVTYTSLSPRRPESVTMAPATNRENAGPATNRMTRQSPLPTERETEPQAQEQRTRENATAVVADSAIPVAAALEVAGEPPATSVDRPTSKPEGSRLDLSSPEATVRSFTKAMISGEAESVLACLLPGGTDYEDIQAILRAKPDDPAQRSHYEMKLWLQSFDPDAEMPILSVEETEQGTSVTWQVTFKKDFTVEGQAFHAGDTFNLDGRLRKSGDSWLIDGI